MASKNKKNKQVNSYVAARCCMKNKIWKFKGYFFFTASQRQELKRKLRKEIEND